MKKIYKKLTEDQIKRGVIFSSCLSTIRDEKEEDIIHEITKEDYLKDQIEAENKERRLNGILEMDK